MSHENVDLVRSLQPAPDVDLVRLFGDADGQLLDALAPFVHDDFIVEAEILDASSQGLRHGVSALKAGWAEWLEPWESYRVEIDDIIDAGDDVVVLTRDYGRRPGMTTEVSVSGAAVWTVTGGKVARIRFFPNREAGLRAFRRAADGTRPATFCMAIV